MAILNFLFGSPLATSDERAERIGATEGIPIFGLDALSSSAYGPEAALTLLIPLGAAGVAYILPISFSIIILLAIVFFSYRQTIETYPGGGGSYTVARANLGVFPGLLAAAALMIDYILVVAVGISAGVGALVSAAPSLQPHTLLLCLAILAAVTMVNLRGVRETGVIFLVPTYLFVGTLLIAIAIGLFKTLGSGGHPAPVVRLPPAPPAGRGCRDYRAAAQGVRQRLYRHDRRGGGQQRREGVPRTDRRKCAPHAGGDHRVTHPDAGGHRLPGARLRNRRHGPRRARISECALHAGGGASRQGTLLLRDDRLHPASSGAVGQHRVRGFPTLVQDHRARWIPAALVRLARPAAGLLPRRVCAGGACRRAVDPVWRRDGPPDSAVRGGRFSGVHALADRHGLPLEADRRTRRAAQHAGEWIGRSGHGRHGAGSVGG